MRRNRHWIEPGIEPPVDAAQECLGGRQVLLPRKEERHVDRHARKDRLPDGRQSFFCVRDLDEQVWRPARANRSLAARKVLSVS
jgi:hypothetical protein